MAEKAKEKENKVAVVAAEVPALMTNADGEIVNVDDLIGQMEDADTGMELTADYLKFEDGESVRLIVVEMTTMAGMGDKKGQEVPAVKLVGADKRFKICADKVLVSTCKGICDAGKAPMMIEVEAKGWKKGPSGEYRDLLIRELLPKGKR